MQTQTTLSKMPERNTGLDLLRILASFMVIVVHSTGLEKVGTTEFYAATLFDGLHRSPVPLFLMLSGTFLLDPEREFSVKRFFKKNVLHLFLAYLFWSVLYATYDMIAHTEVYSIKTAVSFCVTVFSGFQHLWYLLMLLGLYLMVPFLRRICESEKLTLYYCALAVLFCYTANLLRRLPVVGEPIDHLVTVIDPSFVMGYTGYFVMGYALRHFYIPKKWRILLYAAGLLCSAVTVGGTIWLSLAAGENRTMMNNHSFVIIGTTASALFVLFYYACKDTRITFSPRAKRFISRWASLTFAIYLVHGFVLAAVDHLSAVRINPFILIPVRAVLAYAVCYGIARVLKKIPVINKYFI